ncbi:beta-galactoside-binding lectin-like [Archocentrus centrarchus]|uniref:beta-galactoside-binding lectin-like n=1 Tax=Archocentrus centrarchus TaxID=63155 RepID=UPI0011EA3578|nr:beta-galactoside-binding lectin-like [Archocentrus centrarchus]
MSVLIKNMTFEAGQTLTVVGVINPDPKEFELNIGPSEDRIALHFNPRFNAKGNINTIVCNSLEGGGWCEEHREKSFPFCQGQEFKIVIKFTPSEFVVTLPCDSTIRFPNRIGEEKYSVMTFKGDARIRSIEIK